MLVKSSRRTLAAVEIRLRLSGLSFHKPGPQLMQCHASHLVMDSTSAYEPLLERYVDLPLEMKL